MKRTILGAAAMTLLIGCLVFAKEATGKAEQLSPVRIIENSQLAFYYQGDDLKAQVVMELIAPGGGKRTRVMTMLRRNETEGGNQKYFIYFHKPGDVRRMTFMVWKYPAKEDERWIFVPAVDLIKRIAADDKRSSFVGSDFTYEDVSGRDVASDVHRLLRTEKLENLDCYVIGSIPEEPAGYTKRLSWIDKKTFLPLKEEYYDAQNELFRLFTADKIKDIKAGKGAAGKAFPTVMRRTMKNLKTGHRTEVVYTSVSYNLGLKDKDFSERHMRRPPRSWIR
ncbi:MAG: outer membrane lipoprotein-sorting protein [Desulfobacterales bacterium]|nr:outer membrane lipoprotein-sorting protein [Desulfobacterales bacterium]